MVYKWTDIGFQNLSESRFYQQPFTGIQKECSKQPEADKKNSAAAAWVTDTVTTEQQ